MKNKIAFGGISAFVALALFAFFDFAAALEIPVSLSSDGGGKAARIAYADMELIYNVCPQKARASVEYRDAKDSYETRISSLTAAIAERNGEIERLKAAAEDFKKLSSTDNASPESSPPPAAVETAYEKELARKSHEAAVAGLNAKLLEARDEMSAALAELEKSCSTRILEDIYKVLEKIAVEEELLVVIDKNYVLYAPAVYDITPKVIERLK